MKIGIIGTGAMSTSLAGAWTRAGHDVLAAGRPSLRTAVHHGDLILFAVPAAAAPGIAAELADDLAGRTLLDCTNPIAPGPAGPLLTVPAGSSTAAALASAAPGAAVVKAFNLCHASIWTLDPPVFEGLPLGVPYCASTQEAAARTAALITSMHCTPVPCGGLDRAPYLEATAALAIGVWFAAGSPRAMFPPIAQVPAANPQ
ncbi:NADPH-dependent F420 reductase [Dactylosporangium matsuzakiense]|uniref:NADP oxidoreductase n=1 Tax=Dactylosporangium matsuzakiense TaxID=53360 RepID=A0A9W6KRM0_9ACTN|nr:NAD(P)-binding domain-containing protein [Dactylosporangium matsuzakiense]UWZ47919.1 NADP oxidoreductase [Dactylosporangium matsuzakiense]GLL04254.1 NADP oxidoreductase [Dactylosporangium matsuzakiense]